jgi:hypothetical protein
MRVFVVTAVLLLVLAAPGTAQVRTLAEVHTPDRGGRTAFPVIDAYGGHVVWSDYDAGAGVWRLMAHAGGVTQAVPVPPRATPFDVDLGPDGHGGTLAVYSRCARAIRHDFPTPPLDSRRYGCDLYRYSFTTGRESAIARANSGGDETWPAAWRSGLAFVRTNPGRRGPAGKVQQLLWRSSSCCGARSAARDGRGRCAARRRSSPCATARPRGRR